MKTRSASKIAGMMTALILLLVALILQVYAADDYKFEEVTAENDWEFSWQTESYENYAWIQFKGGGVTNVWDFHFERELLARKQQNPCQVCGAGQRSIGIDL